MFSRTASGPKYEANICRRYAPETAPWRWAKGEALFLPEDDEGLPERARRCRLRSVEHLSHFPCEGDRRIRLGQKRRAGIKSPLANDRVLGVAGSEQGFNPGKNPFYRLAHRGAVHVWHDDIGDHQFDWAIAISSRQIQAVFSMAGGNNVIPLMLQYDPGQVAH